MKNRILLIDNYDSFTHNIAHIVKALGYEIDIFRNDAITLDEVAKYEKIILSPGPGIPSEAGILLPVIERFAPTKKILGICLGEQAIGEAFGATLINLSDVFHGVESKATMVTDEKMLGKKDEVLTIGRYHSWVVGAENLPNCLEITAVDENGFIMALRHKTYDVRGVQFHPESILTKDGVEMIRRWIEG